MAMPVSTSIYKSMPLFCRYPSLIKQGLLEAYVAYPPALAQVDARIDGVMGVHAGELEELTCMRACSGVY